MLIVLLAAVLCQPEQTLTPAQAAVGRTFDTRYGAAAPAPGTIVGSPVNILEGRDPAWYTAADSARLNLTRGLCPTTAATVGSTTKTAAVGIVRAHRYLLTPGRKHIFTELDFEIERVVLQGAAQLQRGTTVKVVRAGGAVCTEAGPLQVAHDRQKQLVDGERYLLFLDTNGPYFETSDYDWRLGAETATPMGTSGREVPTAELLASLTGITSCD